jgi:hypothetical protein
MSPAPQSYHHGNKQSQHDRALHALLNIWDKNNLLTRQKGNQKGRSLVPSTTSARFRYHHARGATPLDQRTRAASSWRLRIADGAVATNRRSARHGPSRSRANEEVRRCAADAGQYQLVVKNTSRRGACRAAGRWQSRWLSVIGLVDQRVRRATHRQSPAPSDRRR